MPRLSVHHESSDGGWNEHIDYCKRCYPTLRVAEQTWGDNVDMDNEHPPYSADVYTCETCGRQLRESDS